MSSLDLMGWGEAKTVIAAIVGCLVAGAVVSIVLAGCGGEAKPTSDEVDAGYLRVAKQLRAYTFTIDRATEDPLDRLGQLARDFGSFAGRVDYTARFLMTLQGVGLATRALVVVHSLSIYESVLRSVARLARDRDHGRALERALRAVRSVGIEVRTTDAALERALRTAIAD